MKRLLISILVIVMLAWGCGTILKSISLPYEGTMGIELKLPEGVPDFLKFENFDIEILPNNICRLIFWKEDVTVFVYVRCDKPHILALAYNNMYWIIKDNKPVASTKEGVDAWINKKEV